MAVLYGSAILLAACTPGVLGAALPQMRSEVRSQMAVSLEPGGQLIDQRQTEKSDLPSVCNVNYPLGIKDKSNCSHDHPSHKLINSPWMCEQAAEEARMNGQNPTRNNTDDATFYVNPPWDQIRPRGCFVMSGMFYYNPIAEWPTGTVKGTPVCFEQEYMNASLTGTCPDAYSAIMSEGTCKQAAACLQACTEMHFRVTDNDTDDLTSGCHFSPTTGCVQFNPQVTPTRPSGVGVCNTTVHYPRS